MRRRIKVASILLAALLVRTAGGASVPAGGDVFITLGTMGGPLASPERSQPSNVLVRGNDLYLVDAGDGTVNQLSKAGYSLVNLRAVFISHLHVDHTGGLSAVLGLRNQIDAPGVVTVYGPPGIRPFVDGLIAAMIPAARAGYGLPGEPWTAPAERIRIVEIGDGAKLEIGDFAVSAAQNSHYSFPAGSKMDRRFKSLSFRFDLPGRSIAYTGDTGPSAAVERLARGVDLLVSEMIDVDQTLQNVRRTRPDLSAEAQASVVAHLSQHHLTPLQVGDLAARSGAKRLVVTHLVPGRVTAADEERYLRDIRRQYQGPVVLSHDLDPY